MDCTKWEQFGLLYCAHELGSSEAAAYDDHLKECVECRMEIDSYRRMHASLFSSSNLESAPSPAVDAEIIRICSAPMKRIAGIALLPLFVRKAALPLALFAVTFLAAGYFKYHTDSARQAAALQANAPVVQHAAVQPDTLADSSARDSYANTRGNLTGEGVIQVDLKTK